MQLSFDQNYLLFTFVDSRHPGRQSFAYKLVGLDYYWFVCNQCSQVQYSHLDGGEYTFLVKTTEPNALPTSFRFVVAENVFYRWWFIPMLFLYVLVLISMGVYFFVLYQFRQKLKEQRAIHKAKMDSMSELTAGIAHEIQNPLNFVNNFAEVSTELVTELEDEQQKLNRDTQLEAELLGDLKQNLQKITHHGSRASSIVRGMLEHSRTSTGQKEIINLNALCDEYLRLSYHGLRAKDKGFNADFVTDFAPSLPPVAVVPQELGRVLLNLFNNAFYAVQQKQKTGGADYDPTVSVSTQQAEGQIVIRVHDNGTGIPDAVKAKIFQPFFTTKPTGEGTGLGLSLSYDIVTKGHGGTLTVDSVEGEGAEFIITLPNN